MNIKFSILIPAYKSVFLYEAIQSVLDQSYRNLELIIGDDCSPEELKSIVDKFSDDRIHYFRNDKNFGAVNVVDNWNKCLSYATGDFVICMGDDDKLTPSCLTDYVSIIQKYPGLAVYHTRTLLIDDKSNVWWIQEARPEFESAYSLWWHRWNVRIWQYIGDFLFERKHLVDNMGFYKLPLAWGSDDITAVRAAFIKGIANVQTPGFMYRQSKNTISMSANNRIKADATRMEREWYEKLIESSVGKDTETTIYLSLIKKTYLCYFHKKYVQYLTSDIYNNLFNVFFWIKRRDSYMLSLRMIVLSVFKAMFKHIEASSI